MVIAIIKLTSYIYWYIGNGNFEGLTVVFQADELYQSVEIYGNC